MKKNKPLCKVGDEFYRIIKGNIVKCKITRAEQMPLGHYVYEDNFKYNSTTLGRGFHNKYFKDKKIAKQMLETKEEYAKIKEQYEDLIREKLDIINLLKEVNREQITKEE